MRLSAIFVRFYKSFNYDYLRKIHPTGEQKPWESLLDNLWYPYVRVEIDPFVTTIVGANESGKSHLLSAIEKVLSGKNIRREDFCRYSRFFTVRNGELRYPDFGVELTSLSDEEKINLREICGIREEEVDFEKFLFFRSNKSQIKAYIPSKSKGIKYEPYIIPDGKHSKLVDLLPRTFVIDSDVALPESVNIRRLVSQKDESSDFATMEPEQRNKILELLGNFSDKIPQMENLFKSPFQQAPEDLQKTLRELTTIISNPSFNEKIDRLEHRRKQYELAYKLICKVANVDPDVLIDLANALQEGNGGYARGLIEMINGRLAESLNFPSWWVQDKAFQLKLDLRDYDLVFTIRDRTGTEYSFSERSRGLTYFLSYYIQYRAHEPSGKHEILLMDEPDSYLSSQAQQDLLKIFDAFAKDDSGREAVQVVYVTHSPFLIDKNHAERIRVLEKGVEDEGTRVVHDASKNHYEPLRSAFGAFVGEMAFIGNCNLMVEGLSDQILIAGMAAYFNKQSTSALETLDLNHITIVPASGASHIPYLAYLARGRDVEQPAVVVLLDSDQAGNDAKKALRKGGARRKQILKESLILQIGDLNITDLVVEKEAYSDIEDLIPISICVKAIKKYIQEIYASSEELLGLITIESVQKHLKTAKSTFLAIEACIDAINTKKSESENIHLEKVGFSRYVIETVNELAQASATHKPNDSLASISKNFKTLFKAINQRCREAEREKNDERFTEKIERVKRAFLQDHPSWTRCEDAFLLLEDLEAMLANDKESDDIKTAIQSIRRQYEFEKEPLKHVDGAEYQKFKDDLERIKYAGRINSQAKASSSLT